jgi:hypothetical protein
MGMSDEPALQVLRGFPLRRAVIGILLGAERPVTVAEIVTILREAGATTSPILAKPPNGVIANLLDHQESIGRVMRTARATYVLVPTRMSRSTRWRYLHWRRLSGLTGGG